MGQIFDTDNGDFNYETLGDFRVRQDRVDLARGERIRVSIYRSVEGGVQYRSFLLVIYLVLSVFALVD